MPPTQMPALYLPHGGGPAFFMQGEMHDLFKPMQDFLTTIPSLLPEKPTAILIITAHWETPTVTLSNHPNPGLLYDYYNFPQETYQLTYPAPSNPTLANQAATLLKNAQIEHSLDAERDWDHGVFIPLKVIYPNANIPIVSMSLQQDMDPNTHTTIGQALAPLRDQGVLIIGSGMSYHNLSKFTNGKTAATEFDQWLDRALSGNNTKRHQRLNQWANAPSARAAHPTEEHLLPLMVASGAGSNQPAQKIWHDTVGDSPISAWAFH